MSAYNLRTLLSSFPKAEVLSRKVKAGATVFQEGSPTSRIYFVIEGEIRALRYLSSGQELVFFRARTGAALGEAGAFLEEHPFTAIATVDSVLVSMQKERLLEAFRSQPQLADQFFSCMALRYTEALMMRELSTVRSADERLMMWFQWQASLGDDVMDFEGRMGGIGAELGLTRESIYRSLARLEKQGLIKRERGSVHVLK